MKETTQKISPKVFGNKLLKWYKVHARKLPWRNTKDPYQIWVSEVILQQTRIAQGLSYFYAIIEKYPTVHDLAKAPEDELFSLWQGLGYYSRARNLHQCAKTIVKEKEGRFPNTYEELIKLKGIGSYTAAAIASFAFKEPMAVIDGNVYRVLARMFGIKESIYTAKGKKYFQELASRLLIKNKPDEYNHAIMDFGSLICKPATPLCKDCMYQKYCIAYKKNAQSILPLKKAKIVIKNRYFNYFVFWKDKKVFMRKRDRKDIWKGLYDFFLIETERFTPFLSLQHPLVDWIKRNKINYKDHGFFTKHILTHQHLYIQFVSIQLFEEDTQYTNMQFISPQSLEIFHLEEVKQLPKSIIIQKFLDTCILNNLS